ncbi:MAG: phosphorylase family protein [Planctomycetota bacterium]|jgi:purine-nucleoside phosphorylase
MSAEPQTLDPTIEEAVGDLLDLQLPEPAVLLMAGIGGGLLPERLGDADEAHFPSGAHFGPWSGARIVHGKLRDMSMWIIDDVGIDAPFEPTRPWIHSLPIWVASNLGARLLLHTSAGASLRPETPLCAGGLALVTDHLNLSGQSPLTGLGESRYGPLFPDQTRLHDPALHLVLHRAAQDRGITLHDATAACTTGPSLETPAEQAWYAQAGADISVQGLALPLIGAAHAGIGVGALVTVVQDRGEEADLREILERAEKLAPAIEDLLLGAAPGVVELVEETDHTDLPRVLEED